MDTMAFNSNFTKCYSSSTIDWVTVFSEREPLTFTFAILVHVRYMLQRSCALLRRFKFSAIFLRR